MAGFSQYLRRDPKHRPFMFATGIEGSYPTIRGSDGKNKRVDEFQKTGHYRHWKRDLGLVKELGIDFLRYGPPYYKVHLGPGRYDWSFADETFHRLKELKITPIADLCHFGVPDWLENFQNPDFARYFAEYAAAFANRFPWVELYTPVNEIRIACEFSALSGFWNEQEKSERAFVTALANCARATILGQEAILKVQPEAVFIQSEATGYYHARSPKALTRTHFLNQRRFLGLDLCYGHDVSGSMHEYLLANGIQPQEYQWFLEHGQRLTPTCVMGNDYYAANEHMVAPEDGPIEPAGPVYGYYILTRQYFDRYKLPVMHTETNQLGASDGVQWLYNQWLCMLKLKEDGVPLVGFTWYGLVDQVDWDSALRKDAGRVDHLGLYGLNRRIHPVGKAYRELIKEWRGILPMESRRLDLSPIVDMDRYTSQKSHVRNGDQDGAGNGEHSRRKAGAGKK